ncbi:MAG: hypothetical protein HYR56_19790 [Acidobacteria bacterium]|nr:hypothetical protein [Acidobacteriota bacterium]MBI3422045.1 hypothetical protein [Acidobacteriota bacterium]
MKHSKTLFAMFTALLALSAFITPPSTYAQTVETHETSITPQAAAGGGILEVLEQVKQAQIKAFVGTWVATVTPGGPDAGPSFPSLLTFMADGTALFSAAGPPIPALGNPGHGTWARIGDRTFAATFVQLTFTDIFHLDGTLKISLTIKLNEKLDELTTQDQVKIFDLEGNELVTLDGAQRGKKLQVEINH